ncbi:MAG: amino acid ABC transporter substrate-binding protein [Bacteriovoracaceae bacterium]|nr:amino acid ABC transporter substrate-binding protein [Bacteriovoracaceae bacterium]
MKFLIMISASFLFFFNTVTAGDLDGVLKAKKLKIAVDSTYPPMEFESAEGLVIGLDIDLAREIASLLKVEAEFIVMPWDGILAGLKSNRYDIIMSSMNITPERSAQVNFVPYLKMGQVFVVKKSSKPVTKPSDLNGRTVAVQVDTTSFSAVEGMIKSGVKLKSLKTFPGATETFSAIKANQADVIVTDEAVGKYYAGLDSKTFMVSGNAVAPEVIGIAVKKSDTKLHSAITNAIVKLKANGTYTRLYKKWLNEEPAKSSF